MKKTADEVDRDRERMTGYCSSSQQLTYRTVNDTDHKKIQGICAVLEAEALCSM
jgi:hypothetical protein